MPVGGMRSDGDVLGDMIAVHLSLGDGTSGILQEHVGFAVVVVVTGAGHGPTGCRSDRDVGGNVVAVHLPHRDLAR
jgi:hypothetical protein